MALESAWADAEANGHEDMECLRWILPRSLPGSKDANANQLSAVDCMLAVLRQLFSHHPNSDHPSLKGQDSEDFSGLVGETIRLAMSNFIVNSDEDARKIDAARMAYADAHLAQYGSKKGIPLTFSKLMLCLADLWEFSPGFDLYNQPVGRKRRGIDKYWEPLAANERNALSGKISSIIDWDMSKHSTLLDALETKLGDHQDNDTFYRVALGSPLFLVVEMNPQGIKPPAFNINTIGRLHIPKVKSVCRPVPGDDTLKEVTYRGYDDPTNADEFRLLAVVRQRASVDVPDYVRLYSLQGDNIPPHGDADRCKHFTNNAWSLADLDHCYTLFYIRVGRMTRPESQRLMTEVHTYDIPPSQQQDMATMTEVHTCDIPPSQQQDMAIMTTVFAPNGTPPAARQAALHPATSGRCSSPLAASIFNMSSQ